MQLTHDKLAYAESKPFLELCQALYEFLSAKYPNREELRGKLYHQKDVFENYCEFERLRKLASDNPEVYRKHVGLPYKDSDDVA